GAAESRRVESGLAAERVHLEAGVIAERQLPGKTGGGARLPERVLGIGPPGLLRKSGAGEFGEEPDLEGHVAQERDQLVPLGGIERAEDEDWTRGRRRARPARRAPGAGARPADGCPPRRSRGAR